MTKARVAPLAEIFHVPSLNPEADAAAERGALLLANVSIPRNPLPNKEMTGIIRDLLEGNLSQEQTSNLRPEEFGKFAQQWTTLRDAYLNNGTAGAKKVFQALINANNGFGQFMSHASGVEASASQNPYTHQIKTLADAIAWAEQPKPPMVVFGLLPRSSLNMWHGKPGALKSNLLMDLAMCIATGQNWLPDPPGKTDGRNIGFQVSQGPVLWIDVDMGKNLVTERLAAFATAYGVTDCAMENFHWTSFPDPPLACAKGLNTLINCVSNMQPVFIGLDNLTTISGVKDQNSSEMSIAMNELRELVEVTTASVNIAHHDTREDKGRYRGHGSIEAAIDYGFNIVRNGNVLTVKPGKTRRKERELISAMYTCEVKPDGETLHACRFWRAQTSDSQIEAQSDLKSKVLEALAQGPQSVQQLRKTVCGRTTSIDTAIKNLEESGRIEKKKIGQKVTYSMCDSKCGAEEFY